MKVSQYMTRPVVTVTPQTEFHRAFDLMRSRRIHHLPVVEGDQVVGLVAERDLLLAAANYGPAEVAVGEIMHSPAVCVAEHAELREAARLLVVEHIGSLPVLGAARTLVGIITETDIFKIAAGMLRPRAEAAGRARKTAGKPARKTAKKASKQPAKKSAAKKTGRKPAAKKRSAAASRKPAGGGRSRAGGAKVR